MTLKDRFKDIHNEIITLCGTTRFKESYEQVNIALTLNRNVVFSVVCFSHADMRNTTEEEKKIFDEMHKAKIDVSDSIFVIDIDLTVPEGEREKYIGLSTGSEVLHAGKSNRKIRFLSDYFD